MSSTAKTTYKVETGRADSAGRYTLAVVAYRGETKIASLLVGAFAQSVAGTVSMTRAATMTEALCDYFNKDGHPVDIHIVLEQLIEFYQDTKTET